MWSAWRRREWITFPSARLRTPRARSISRSKSAMLQAENLDPLIADELQAHFACATIGRRIVVLEQTGSTNDAILQVANANATEGLVLFAEHQTAGRGQRGNRWESARGKGLWFSILLRPKIQIND